MTNPPKFYDLPTGYVPSNRRVYNLAKKPFEWLWAGVSWLILPFLTALPFAMGASAVLNIFLHVHAGTAVFTGTVAYEIFAVGVVWTGYLGALFLVLTLLGALRKL